MGRDFSKSMRSTSPRKSKVRTSGIRKTEIRTAAARRCHGSGQARALVALGKENGRRRDRADGNKKHEKALQPAKGGHHLPPCDGSGSAPPRERRQTESWPSRGAH